MVFEENLSEKGKTDNLAGDRHSHHSHSGTVVYKI